MHHKIIKCTKCKKTFPLSDLPTMWVFINVELREVECPACGGTTFSITEVPDHG